MRDSRRGTKIQGFAPRKIVTITATVAWTPDVNDEAFRVGVSCTYVNSSDGAGHSANLLAGSITVLPAIPDRTYTFDTTMEIEVM